jgi:hypothetical protein
MVYLYFSHDDYCTQRRDIQYKCGCKFMGGKLILLQLVLYPSSDTNMSSLNIIQAIKSCRMRWVGHVACMEKRQGAHRILVENSRKDMGMDGRIDL